jgi:hypothetical protein
MLEIMVIRPCTVGFRRNLTVPEPLLNPLDKYHQITYHLGGSSALSLTCWNIQLAKGASLLSQAAAVYAYVSA